jgi:hypothetical protein
MSSSPNQRAEFSDSPMIPQSMIIGITPDRSFDEETGASFLKVHNVQHELLISALNGLQALMDIRNGRRTVESNAVDISHEVKMMRSPSIVTISSKTVQIERG